MYKNRHTLFSRFKNKKNRSLKHTNVGKKTHVTLVWITWLQARTKYSVVVKVIHSRSVCWYMGLVNTTMLCNLGYSNNSDACRDINAGGCEWLGNVKCYTGYFHSATTLIITVMYYVPYLVKLASKFSLLQCLQLTDGNSLSIEYFIVVLPSF